MGYPTRRGAGPAAARATETPGSMNRRIRSVQESHQRAANLCRLRDLPEQADTLSFPIPVPRLIIPRSALAACQIIEAEAGEQPDRG